MSTIDIKKSLPPELRNQEYWQGMSDAFSSELEFLRTLIEEKQYHYDIYRLEEEAIYNESNSKLIELISAYGGYLNISLNDTPEYIRQQIELFKFFITNKSRYPFYNFAYKMTAHNGDTFIYFWNGKKMIRAIDDFSIDLQNKIDTDTLHIPMNVYGVKNYDVFVVGDNLLDVEPPLFLDSTIPWYLDQSYSRITTKHTSCEIIAGSYDRKIIENSKYNIFENEFDLIESTKYTRNNISSDYLTSYISEDIFADVTRELHSFADTTSLLTIVEKEITITKALDKNNVLQYIDSNIPLQLIEYNEIRGLVKQSTMDEGGTTKYIKIYRKSLLGNDEYIGQVSINTTTNEFIISSEYLSGFNLLCLRVEDSSISYGPLLISGSYYGDYYDNIYVSMFDIKGTKTQLSSYYTRNCFKAGITLFKRNNEFISYGEIRLVSNNALLNITQIKTIFPTSYINTFGTGLESTTNTPLDNRVTLIDISKTIMSYCFYNKEEKAIELINHTLSFMYDDNFLPFLYYTSRNTNDTLDRYIRSDAICYFLLSLLSFIEIFELSNYRDDYISQFSNIYNSLLLFQASSSPIINKLIHRGYGFYTNNTTFNSSYISTNFYFGDNYLFYVLTKKANSLFSDSSYDYSTIETQLEAMYDTPNLSYFLYKETDNTPSSSSPNELELMYQMLYCLESAQYTKAENIKTILDASYTSNYFTFNGGAISNEISLLSTFVFYHLDNETYLSYLYGILKNIKTRLSSSLYDSLILYPSYTINGLENNYGFQNIGSNISISMIADYIFTRGKVKIYLLSNDYTIQYDDSYVLGSSQENSLIEKDGNEYLMIPEYIQYLQSIISHYKKVTDVNHVGFQLNLICDSQGYYDVNDGGLDYTLPSIKTKCATNDDYNPNMLLITDIIGIMVGKGSLSIPSSSTGTPLSISAIDDFVLYSELDLEEKITIETETSSWNCIITQIPANTIKGEEVGIGSSSVSVYSGQSKFFPILKKSVQFKYISSGGFKYVNDRNNILEGRDQAGNIFATCDFDYVTGAYTLYTQATRIIEEENIAEYSLGTIELSHSLIYGELDVGSIVISYTIDNNVYKMIDIPDDITNLTGTFKAYSNTSQNPFAVTSATIDYVTRNIEITFASDSTNIVAKYNYIVTTNPDSGTTLYIDYGTEDNIAITEAALIDKNGDIAAYATFPPIVLGNNSNHISLHYFIYNGTFY
jgi:hypothetical protein